MMAQETKAPGDAGVTRIRTSGRNLGWNFTASPALRTECDKGSGGCVVGCRKGMGISPHPDSLLQDGFAHRFKMAWCAGVLRGGIHVGSVYLQDGVGLAEVNLLILEQIGAALRT